MTEDDCGKLERFLNQLLTTNAELSGIDFPKCYIFSSRAMMCNQQTNSVKRDT